MFWFWETVSQITKIEKYHNWTRYWKVDISVKYVHPQQKESNVKNDLSVRYGA